MASQRLTNAIKESIVSKMRKELFEKRQEKARKRTTKLADNIYHAIHTEEETNYMLMAPDGAFAYRTSIYARFASGGVSFGLSKAFPFFSRYDGQTQHISVDSSFYAEYNAIKKTEDKIRKDIQKLHDSTWGILNSVTTVKKLIEVWPDVEPYLPENKQIPNLPAIPVGELNVLLEELRAKDE